jgi:putative ABC transport system permease protein
VVVVGVAGTGFTGPVLPSQDPPAFWIPWNAGAYLLGDQRQLTSSDVSVELAGRLRPDVGVRQAQAELGTLASQFSVGRAAKNSQVGVLVGPLSEQDRAVGALFMAVLAAFVVIGYVNLINLQVATAEFRRRETAVRVALGVSRGRLFRQALLEGTFLSVPAAAAGSVLAFTLVPLLAPAFGIADTVALRPNASSLLVATLLTVGALIATAIPQRGIWITRGATRYQRGIASVARRSVFVQTTAAAIFMLLAALFARALGHVAEFDYGFDVNRLLEGRAASSADTKRIEAGFWAAAVSTVRNTAGVEAVAVANHSPLAARIDSSVHSTATTSEFFEVMGFRILQGRTYTTDEVHANANVAVVTSKVARAFWPDADPLGADLGRVNRRLAGVVIIGVIVDAATNRIGFPNPGMVYRPLSTPGPNAILVARTHGEAALTARSVRDTLARLDPAIAMRVTPLADYYREQLQHVRLLTTVAGGLALLAMVIAVGGVAAVTAYAVGRRGQEMAVRLAVGATVAQVHRLFVADTLRPAMVGLLIAIAVVTALGQLFASVFYGIKPWDPAALFCGGLVLLITIGLAAIVSAGRAGRLDPAVILRQV